MTLLASKVVDVFAISIHMPHTWHDLRGLENTVYCAVISIHMPHTWHDAEQLAAPHAAVISIHMPHTWHDGNADNLRW